MIFPVNGNKVHNSINDADPNEASRRKQDLDLILCYIQCKQMIKYLNVKLQYNTPKGKKS